MLARFISSTTATKNTNKYYYYYKQKCLERRLLRSTAAIDSIDLGIGERLATEPQRKLEIVDGIAGQLHAGTA